MPSKLRATLVAIVVVVGLAGRQTGVGVAAGVSVDLGPDMGVASATVFGDRRITVPSGAYFYGATYSGMTPDGGHLFVSSGSRLDLPPSIAGEGARPFDVVAGRILLVGPLAVPHAWVRGTSATGGTVVVESSARLVAEDQDDSYDLYLVSGSTVQLIAPTADFPRYQGMAEDGSAVVFSTQTSLLAADTDETQDLYLWHAATGIVNLVSTGTSDPSLVAQPTLVHVSPDASSVLFTLPYAVTLTTDESIYEWSASGVAVRGSGAFVSQSADGSRVYSNSREPLVPDDHDGDWDAYVHDAAGFHLLSDATVGWTRLDAVSADGTSLVLSSFDALAPEDDDSSLDAYLVSGAAPMLLTRGAQDADWRATDASFTSGIYETRAPVSPADTDASIDVYQTGLPAVGDPALVAPQTADGDVRAVAYAANGSRILVQSGGRLLPEDMDNFDDYYEWTGDTLHLVSPGSMPVQLKGWSLDLRRIVFESGQVLTPEDENGGVEDVYISDADLTPPVAQVDAPTTSGPVASLSFGTADGDGIWFDCSLDGAAWSPCSSPLRLEGLAVGTHSLAVRAWDAAANASTASVTWSVEAPREPTASMVPLPTWVTSASVRLQWHAAPAGDPIVSYDVRYRRAAWNGRFGGYVQWRTATTATQSTFPAKVGSTYCFSVRARDEAAVISSWSAPACTAVPLDDRSLTRTASWMTRTGSAYYRSTYLRSSTQGARVSLRDVAASKIGLLATTCSSCGTVKVYWNGVLLRTVSLYSRTTVHRRVIPVASFGSARRGTVTVRITSSGRQVRIDGLAIRKT